MDRVSYLVISDIHIGHRVNEADNIYNNFKDFMDIHKPLLYDKDKNPTGIKAIFIAGDLFDRFLPSYSYEFAIGYRLLTDLLDICKSRGIILRVLEGTPLHDWGQSRLFNDLIKELKVDIDFKYISKLEIEKIDSLNLTVLYVPDEVNHDASKTFKQVKKLLKDNNLDKVDIAIMHGAFTYQIPMFKSDAFHKEEDYESIVKYSIHPGHVHSYSSKGKIIAQGSFDRLSHNEEEDKGCVVNTIDFGSEECNPVFLKNKNAMIFKTIDLRRKDIKDVIKSLKIEFKGLKIGSALRILTEDKDKIKSALEALDINTVKNYKVKIKVDDGDKGTIRDVVADKEEELGVVSLSRENLFEEISSHPDFINSSLETKEKIKSILVSLDIPIISLNNN